MIENIVKASTCKVECGSELGTGFLVSSTLILTARHCISDAFDKPETINLKFPDYSTEFEATIVSDSEEFDICLLSISQEVDLIPLQFVDSLPREGSIWYAFGFPKVKRSLGHRVNGNVSQSLREPKLKIDLDLALDTSSALTAYEGLSGSPLICENECCGLLRIKTDKTLGAISGSQIAGFLLQNEIQTKSRNSIPEKPLAGRTEFTLQFEKKLKDNFGKYIFLGGANGIGKTTYCSNFQASDPSLLILGSYSFSSVEREAGAALRIQPNVFFDWIFTSISTLLTGKAARKEEKSFSELVEHTSHILDDFSKYCLSKDLLGVIFIDGLNEAQAISDELFSQFIGLLPITLPKGITVVFTAPNFEIISPHFTGRVNSENQIELPSLQRDVAYNYCCREIREDRSSPSVITRICEKAQGHPLYLRYLIEFVNNCTGLDELESFPQFSGSIGEYYEQLWSRLLQDQEAVHLLAILARLRWGIDIGVLPNILRPEEVAVLVPTLSRIRHLLANSDQTTIYHSSFGEFLLEKTSRLNEVIEGRLTDFCIQYSELEYCALNSVFHALNSDSSGLLLAIQLCEQSWVDTCVTLGVKPDTLLFDIEEVLAVVVEFGSTVDVVRILLLSHRTNFRYNTLFTQSAYLITEALISLGKPKEALQHAIRFNRLIISPDETFRVILLLNDKDYKEEASELLKLLRNLITESLYRDEHTIEEYITLCGLYIRSLLLMGVIDGKSRTRQVISFLSQSVTSIRDSIENITDDELSHILVDLQCQFPGFYLYFYDSYAGLSEIREREHPVPENILELLIYTLNQAMSWHSGSQKVQSYSSLLAVFSDIEEVLSSDSFANTDITLADASMLIKLGAPKSLIKSVSIDHHNLPMTFSLLDESGVELDYEKLYEHQMYWRTVSFLDNVQECPLVSNFDQINWLQSFKQLFSALSWCEGKARRGKIENDKELLHLALENLQSNVLQPLSFSLQERVTWENSYFIPEKALPLIYRTLSELYLECFPDELQFFLKHVSTNFNRQLGIYSEGFRNVLFEISDSFTSSSLEEEVENEIFNLINKWKDFIVDNLENRHELVPELLKLIPLFVKVDAKEIAEQLYPYMLNVSMGPNWYKEDQFGLMVSYLTNAETLNDKSVVASQIAGYLEKASGEMTFQRFVRYEKAALIGELVRQNKCSQAINYFKRQTCGTLTELRSEATKGDIDRVSTYSGMRFPGGALDEQDAILKIVSNVKNANWRLCWSLLEIYLFGDDRHLSNYACEFAEIINSASTEPEIISEMAIRMKLLIASEMNPDKYLDFITSFKQSLNITLHDDFHGIFELLPTQEISSFPPEIYEEKSIDVPSESKSKRDDDMLFMPGTFGRESATVEASQYLKKAEAKLARQNTREAQSLAVTGLQILQQGGWSIWGNLSGEANRMMAILQEGELTLDEKTHLYAPLILEERYAPRWRIAEHLIDESANKLNSEHSASLAQCVLDHIKLMVGDAQHEIREFKFIEDEGNNSTSEELFSFLVWIVDHPQWLRQEKAANIFTWLLENNSSYYIHAVPQAFSMQTGFGADVLCGVLASLSRKQPLQTWDLMKPFLDMNIVIEKCHHISRLTVLCNIAERASVLGSTSASSVASDINSILNAELTQGQVQNQDMKLPDWAFCIRKEWKELDAVKLINGELVALLNEEMGNVCSPLDIETAWTIEKAVAKGFQVLEKNPLNRWESRVRFALNVALFRTEFRKDNLKIEPILRVYNPSTLWLTLKDGSESRAEKIFEALSNGCDPIDVINNKNSILLNYQEIIDREDIGKCIQIEITAVLTSRYSNYQPNLPDDNALFGSKEYPDEAKKVASYETCHRVAPDSIFLGTFTPALPTTSFIKLIGGKQEDFIRSNWKQGRSDNLRRPGLPNHEGCLLAIKSHALHLPEGHKLAWIFKVNGEIVGIRNGMENK